MLIKLFVVPVGDNGAILGEMTAFLKAHKVLEIESHFISKPNGESWHFCIRYIESATNLPFGDSKTKIDYRETLDEATFVKFSKLREIRKKVALDAGVSPFIVFTDAELAELAKMDSITVAKMRTIKGVGEGKIEKYGAHFITKTDNTKNEKGQLFD